jgi:dolichyl-phosphate beta-glucosyltransferase
MSGIGARLVSPEMPVSSAGFAVGAEAVREVKPVVRPPCGPMTVILPVFNESATLAGTLEALSAFAAIAPRCRLLLVDDGSRDATSEILRAALGPALPTPTITDGPPALAPGDSRGPDAEHPAIAYISYPINRGKGHAIRVGVEALAGEPDGLVVFMDGDMAYGLDHLVEMEAALAQFDVVIGSRKESPEERRNTKKLRRLMGWTFNQLVRVGMGLPFKDTQAGLKGFRLSAARAIFPRIRLRGFAFDVEALFIARQRGYRIGEIPARVARAHRKKPSNVNLAFEPLKMAGDLLRIRWNWLLGRYR